MARKKFNANFKAQVALDVLKNEQTLSELAQKYGVHPTQIKEWKTTLQANAPILFERKNKADDGKDAYIEALERKAGQQAIELDFLKKNLTIYHKGKG